MRMNPIPAVFVAHWRGWIGVNVGNVTHVVPHDDGIRGCCPGGRLLWSPGHYSNTPTTLGRSSVQEHLDITKKNTPVTSDVK